MAIDEGIELVVKSIKAAIERDIGSGGKNFEVAVIDKNGYREIPKEQLKRFS